MLYDGGIIDDVDCGTNLNHAVLAVGNGQDENDDTYFILKNSFGEDWGEDGYFRIKLSNGAGYCGMNKQSYQPYADNI